MADAKDTEVGKWLLANGGDQYVDKFFEQGYEFKADLSKEAIDKIVANTPGLAARLDRLLTAEQPKPKEHKDTTAPEIPALPPGTPLDLSQAVITAPDVPPFTLPAQLSVQSDNAAVISPAELKPEDWMILARNSRMLYGYSMETFTGEGPPPQARHPVLEWVVPSRDDFVQARELEAEVTADLTYSEETASYVRAGFDTESASAGYMYCSASFEREHKERQARSSRPVHRQRN